jgi:hypothetical protein
MKSKKALFEFLATRFNKTGVQLGAHGISDETYGRKSMIYLWNIQEEWGVSRDEMDRILGVAGFKVNRRYGRMDNKDLYGATEVQVSYFKGHHWDE